MTKDELLAIAMEAGACWECLEWLAAQDSIDAIRSAESIRLGYYDWVCANVPFAPLEFTPDEIDEAKTDANWWVRRTVARKGYALEELKNDEDWSVSSVARRQLARIAQGERRQRKARQ